MNILSNSLKTNFVTTLMCPPGQKLQFHHHSASSPTLTNLIENNALPLPSRNAYRTFSNPNIFNNQTTCGENHPSSYNKSSNHRFDVAEVEEVANSNSSESMISLIDDHKNIEKTDFGAEVKLISRPHCNRKRRRKSNKNRLKVPEKHNQNRQVVNEMMDIDEQSTNNVDEEMEENSDNSFCPFNSLKLCDLLVIPKHSSPICVPKFETCRSPKISAQTTTCIAFSISPPNVMRPRQLSVTESEDSFIVFDSGTDEECDFSEDACSESENSDSGDEESDENDFDDSDSPGSVIPTKKVRFAEDKELCEVHPMIQWSYAYQAARKGPWEVYARDRERFKNKIKNVGEKITHCFEPEHRQKVFDQRFKEK